MLELTIKGNTYSFNFGMGFMRKVNKMVGTPVDGLPDVKKNIGLQYYIAGVIDGDVEALVDILVAGNEGQEPRVTRDLLDYHIDNECSDVDALFDEVLDFLEKTNATKRTVANLMEAIEREKMKATM